MIIIKHRCNSLEDLIALDCSFGVEVDVRNHGQDLIVVHDPFDVSGPNFREWLLHYRHKFLIVNVKEEGLEGAIIKLFDEFRVTDFFILDESFPFIRKWAIKGFPNFAVRVSEFESSQTALNLMRDLRSQKVSVDWVWVDTFSSEPLPLEEYNDLKASQFQTCYVSPELHFLDEPHLWRDMIDEFAKSLEDQDVRPDAVCTKLPDYWQERLYL